MYKQVLDPVSHSLGLTSIFAILPLLVLFVLLGVVRLKAQWASMAALGVAIIVAIAVYSMPVGQTFDTGAEGAAFGFFPIMWIVINALWVYNLTVETGHFAVLRRAFTQISEDLRVQVIMIAFCFGSLLEALAGFGTPVAICGVMMVSLGVRPIKAACLALLADTAPVAFGAIAIPIITLAETSGVPKHLLSEMVGRQCPILAFFIPFLLIVMSSGVRSVRGAWPAALTAGGTFAVMQFVTSNYISPELTDIIASLSSAAALLALMQVWSPAAPMRSDEEEVPGTLPPLAGASAEDGSLARRTRAEEGEPISRSEMFMAFVPYIIIILVLGICSITSITADLDKLTTEFSWPGLHVVDPSGAPLTSETYKLNWFTAAGTQLLVAGLLSALVLRVTPRRMVFVYLKTLRELAWPIVTVSAVLALAYVMNFSGQTVTLGTWAAGAGGFFAFLSPIIGWFGTAVTGSDTSTNSLFGALQAAAAKQSHLSAVLLAGANSSGGVLAKMISPQNLAIGAAAVGLGGSEGDIFRRVLPWSVGLILAMALLVLLQSTAVLSWMVP
jgi:lactate permease